MANGRFLSKSVAVSEQLGSVSLLAAHLFVMCLAHLDREGRITGSAAGLKGTAVPLRPEITTEIIPSLLAELAAAMGPEGEPLVQLYESNGCPAAYFPGFARSQQGLRVDREAPSQFTTPPSTPARMREDSRENGAQGKLRQVKGSEGTTTDVGSWNARVSALFTKTCGPCSPGEAGAALTSQVGPEGFSPDETVRAAEHYVKHSTDKEQFRHVRTFAKQLPQWVKKSAPVDITDEDSGGVSAELKSALGAA